MPFMNLLSAAPIAKLQGLAKFYLYSKKIAAGFWAISEGFYLVFRHRLYKDPNNPQHTRYVQHVCRRLCEVFNVQVKIHGEIPRHPSLWVGNHVSWLDIPVFGSGARVFFLAKAEIAQWPIVGQLAKGGGTLFIKRGSGDSGRVREQITGFLKQDIPVLFFPEATTSDGRGIKKIHGRLLEAAIDAQRPVQVMLICYVNQHGELDMIAPFIDQMTFLDHIQRVLEMPKVTAHLMMLPEISVQGHNVESLTEEVQLRMTEGLQRLHAKVLGAAQQDVEQ